VAASTDRRFRHSCSSGVASLLCAKLDGAANTMIEEPLWWTNALMRARATALRKTFRKPLLDSFLTHDANTSSTTSLQKLEYPRSPVLPSGWVSLT
jgi:hypothetical protein